MARVMRGGANMPNPKSGHHGAAGHEWPAPWGEHESAPYRGWVDEIAEVTTLDARRAELILMFTVGGICHGIEQRSPPLAEDLSSLLRVVVLPRFRGPDGARARARIEAQLVDAMGLPWGVAAVVVARVAQLLAERLSN